MSVLRGPLVPRILLGVMGVLTLLLAWGSVRSLLAYGPQAESVLMLVIAAPLAVICFSVAAGCAPFRIGE